MRMQIAKINDFDAGRRFFEEYDIPYNQCKNYTWEELGDKINGISISVHGIQTGGFNSSDPETLWSMCQ